MQEIIWEGNKQSFIFEQLAQVEAILVLMPGLYRWTKRTHLVMQIFLPNIGELLAQGYVIHHINGDPSNDHPSNLMVILRGAHTKMHWEQLSPDDYTSRCEVHRQGRAAMTPEAKQAHSENTSHGLILYNAQITSERRAELNEIKRRGQNGRPKEVKQAHYEAMRKGQANMSEEAKFAKAEAYKESRKKYEMQLTDKKRVERCKVLSEGHGGPGNRAYEFIENHSESFCNMDINRVANFSGQSAMGNWLAAQIKTGNVKIIGKKGNGYIYLSLICKNNLKPTSHLMLPYEKGLLAMRSSR